MLTSDSDPARRRDDMVRPPHGTPGSDPGRIVDAGGDTVELTLPADPAAAATARSWVHNRWAELDAGHLDDIELIVTELVSNAVRHGRPEIVLRLRNNPFAVDIAVLDHGPGTPQKKTPSAISASGRGLQIIEQLASRWGVQPLTNGTGKLVWASVAAQ